MRQGLARYGRQGKVWSGMARHGKAWHGRRGRRGVAGCGRRGLVRLGKERQGTAGNPIKFFKEVNRVVYEWKSTAKYHIKADAQTAGAVCEELEKKGGLTAEALVDVSRSEDAPLHNEFEWDNDVAAEKHRVSQARYIIRALVIKREDVDEDGNIVEEEPDAAPVRAFFTVDKQAGYESTQKIITCAEKRTALLDTAMKELHSFERKYQTLTELYPLFLEIHKLDGTLNESA